jgi:hypothetical protein
MSNHQLTDSEMIDESVSLADEALHTVNKLLSELRQRDIEGGSYFMRIMCAALDAHHSLTLVLEATEDYVDYLEEKEEHE